MSLENQISQLKHYLPYLSCKRDSITTTAALRSVRPRLRRWPKTDRGRYSLVGRAYWVCLRGGCERGCVESRTTTATPVVWKVKPFRGVLASDEAGITTSSASFTCFFFFFYRTLRQNGHLYMNLARRLSTLYRGCSWTYNLWALQVYTRTVVNAYRWLNTLTIYTTDIF